MVILVILACIDSVEERMLAYRTANGDGAKQGFGSTGTSSNSTLNSDELSVLAGRDNNDDDCTMPSRGGRKGGGGSVRGQGHGHGPRAATTAATPTAERLRFWFGISDVDASRGPQGNSHT